MNLRSVNFILVPFVNEIFFNFLTLFRRNCIQWLFFLFIWNNKNEFMFMMCKSDLFYLFCVCMYVIDFVLRNPFTDKKAKLYLFGKWKVFFLLKMSPHGWTQFTFCCRWIFYLFFYIFFLLSLCISTLVFCPHKQTLWCIIIISCVWQSHLWQWKQATVATTTKLLNVSMQSIVYGWLPFNFSRIFQHSHPYRNDLEQLVMTPLMTIETIEMQLFPFILLFHFNSWFSLDKVFFSAFDLKVVAKSSAFDSFKIEIALDN